MEDLPPSIGPSVDFVLRRTKILKEHADAVLEVKDRAVRAFGEQVLHEIEWLVLCGWPKEHAYLPAVNNLGVRKQEIQEELITELGRLQERLRERMARLMEELDDE